MYKGAFQVLDQCSQKLHLSSAARRLYTGDGTQILHMDQLKQWVERVAKESRKSSLPQQQQQTQQSGSDSGSHASNVKENRQEKTDGKVYFCL